MNYLNYSTSHIHYLERTFLDSPKQSGCLQQTGWLPMDQGSVGFLRILSVPRASQTDLWSGDVFYRMTDVLSGVSSLGLSVIFVVAGTSKEVNVYLGVGSHIGIQSSTTGAQNAALLAALLQGTFPGIECVEFTPDHTHNLQQWLRGFSHSAAMCGTPSCAEPIHPSILDQRLVHGTQRQSPTLQIDRLVRSLQSAFWAYILVSTPLPQMELNTLSRSTVDELQRIADAEASVGVPSPIAETYRQLLYTLSRKIQWGKGQGMWQSIGYLLANDLPTLERLKAMTRAISGGEWARPDPPRVFEAPHIVQQIADFALPDMPPPEAPGQIRYPQRFLALVNSYELSMVMHPPSQEAIGYFVRPGARFDVTPHRSARPEHAIVLGDISNQGTSTGVAYATDLDTLTRHTMVVGVTGSGKTNTVFNMLRQLAAHTIPFLVIEPSKTEYRALLESELGGRLRVFTLGDELRSPFRLNPFEILPGVSVQSHIDHLKQVFHASFVMYAPMPYVLEECIHEVYRDKGWDLVTSTNSRGAHLRAYPTLGDLYAKVDEVIQRKGWEDKIRMNIRASLKTRINNLRIGGKGLMLDTPVSIPMSVLLESPTILELDAVSADDEKAFLIGLILTMMYEHYRSNGHGENAPLRHITVIEEAHRLLKEQVASNDPEAATMAGEAVEQFSSILAEIRAYGEGIVVVDQIPSKITRDVVKHTNLKIVHRIAAEEDRVLMGGTMGADADQTRWLGTCSVGEAAVFSSDDDSPIRINVPYRKMPITTIADQRDTLVRETASALRAEHRQVFEPYNWATIDPDILLRHRFQARTIAEEPEFRVLFARYIISAMVHPATLVQGFASVAQGVRKYGHAGDMDALLEVGVLHSLDMLIEQRGWQHGVPYTDIEQLKRRIAAVIYRAVIPAWRKRQSLEADSPQLSQELGAIQDSYRKLFTCRTSPFIGCSRVCAEHGCLYRHNVEPLVADTHLQRNFIDALAQSDGPELFERVAGVATSAVRRILAHDVPAAEKRLAGLCFAIQVSEINAALDDHLKEKLIDGLLKVPNESAGSPQGTA
jgi:hypothetical protein